MHNFKNQLEQMVEPLAKHFTAEQIGVVDDKEIENLPFNLWKQNLNKARKFLNLE